MNAMQTVVNHLWQSTVFAAVIGLATLAFRKNRAAVRHALWLAASIKFLVPFAALVALGGALGVRASATIPPAQREVVIVLEDASHALPILAGAFPSPPSPVPAASVA